MIKLLLLFLYLGMWCGCKSTQAVDAKPFEYRFEKTAERTESQKSDKRTITVRFDGLPFGQAMGVLSQEANVPIVWSQSLDSAQAVGTFSNVSIATVLDVLARRVGSAVAEVGGVYYLGEIRKQDRAFAVIRIPPVDRTQILEAIKSSCSVEGTVSMVGSTLWVCDDIESLRKVTAAVESIRERNERAYIAEIYFIRVNEDHFVSLTADLQLKQIDVFSSAFNVNELFAMFVDADGGTGRGRISQRPILYLSEGRKVVFSDGKEITREKKTLTETGAVETTGYTKFSDGLQLSMTLNRVSDESYMVDMDLSVSVFDKSDKSDIPAKDVNQFTAEGLLVRDSQVYYVGSLRRDQRGDKAGLFSFDLTKSGDMVTIWLRVRELKGS